MSASGHTGRAELPSFAMFGSTEQLRAEALSALPPDVSAEPPERQEGRDDSGTVRVTVDADGRPVAVDIDRGWRGRLAADDLPAALHQAYGTAVSQAAEAWAMARLVSTERGASPAEAERPSAQEPLPRAPSAPGEWLTWFRREQELIHADREERRRSHGALERQHRGPHGFLTAIVRGSTVVAVTGDAAGLRFVDTRLLQEDALEVLSVPGRRSGGSSTASE